MVPVLLEDAAARPAAVKFTEVVGVVDNVGYGVNSNRGDVLAENKVGVAEYEMKANNGDVVVVPVSVSVPVILKFIVPVQEILDD